MKNEIQTLWENSDPLGAIVNQKKSLTCHSLSYTCNNSLHYYKYKTSQGLLLIYNPTCDDIRLTRLTSESA